MQLLLRLPVLLVDIERAFCGGKQEAFQKMSVTGRFDELPALLSAVKEQRDLRSSATSSAKCRASQPWSDDARSRRQLEELRGQSFHNSGRGCQVTELPITVKPLEALAL